MAGCAETVLDCGNATQRARTVALNPRDVFTAPPVSCGNATAGVLRVFSGAECALYKTDNAAGCAWDTVKQAFTGAGCVVANETACACTHLTRRVRFLLARELRAVPLNPETLRRMQLHGRAGA
jgi:hypothetical protein